MSRVRFTISKQKFFHNGNLLLPLLVDRANNRLEEAIVNWLGQEYEILDKPHETKRRSWLGYDAGNINTVLKSTMRTAIIGMHAETHVEYNGLIQKTIKGFDFALYDEEYNYRIIRNYFIGDPGVIYGDYKIIQIYKDLRLSRDEWLQKINDIGGNPGENVEAEKSCLTIVGEIQLGNWALAEHDVLRVNDLKGVDYYIYITPTGNLQDKLSDGIVTFDKICNVLKTKETKIPTWVIGIEATPITD